MAEKIAFDRKIRGLRAFVFVGQTIEESVARVSSIVLGEKRLEQVPVTFNEGDPPRKPPNVESLSQEMGLIGGNFLKHFEVTIDGPNAAIYLEGPYPDVPDIWSLAYTGINLTLSNGQWLVFQVLQPSPASEAGIRVGDELLEVDGKSTKGLSNSRIGELLNGPENSTVRLVIQRKRKSFWFIRRGAKKRVLEVARRKLL